MSSSLIETQELPPDAPGVAEDQYAAPEPSPDALWWHFQGRETQKRVFLTALAIRLVVILLTISFSATLVDLSRDSIKYAMRGTDIAQSYANGTNDWTLWIDHGWFQLVGVVFWLVGPFLELVQFFNAFVAAACAAMLCRIAFIVTQNRAVTILSGYTLAIFPSFVWYSSLPLKDASGLFALEAVCLGILLLRVNRNQNGWTWIAFGILVLVAIRVYLVVVCVGCIALCLLPIDLPGGFAGVLKWCAAAALFAGGVYLAVGAAGIDVEENNVLFQYFDIDRINNVRDGMNSGNARFFEHDHESQYGHGIINDALLFSKGIFFFFFSVDLTNVTRARQLAALPELFFFVLCLPYLYYGVVHGWNRGPEKALPLILFGLALMVVYSSATTNMGAMYRWRMQAVPFLIVLITYGALLMQRGPLYQLLAPLELRRDEVR